MITDQINKLNAAKAKLAALESAVAAERNAALVTLPARYGFTTVAAFVAAVRAATGQRRGRQAKSAAAAPKSKTAKIRRKRAVITDATRAALKKLVEAGQTGNEIAKALKISRPSVQNIKKTLGLVQKKKK